MAKVKSIEDLPDELLLKIFSNFTIEELAMTIRHVSWHWRNVSQDGDLWKDKIYFPDYNASDKEILQHLKNMPSLKAFAPGRGVNSKSIINTLCKTCRDIELLEFTEFQRLTPHTLKQILRSYPNLKQIRFPICKTAGKLQFFKILRQFNNLTTLAFTDPATDVIVDNVLYIIAEGCPSLQHVDLGYVPFHVQDIDCLLEKKQHQLVSLSIRCYITTNTLALLSGCTKLEYFEYVNYNENLTRADMHLLSKISSLKKVILLYFVGTPLRAMPSMFANNALSQLTKLHLIFSKNTEPQTLNDILSNCPNLKDFKILDDELNGGFKTISSCNRLEKLTIYCRALTDESLEPIGAGCHLLKYLDIQTCSLLTDKAIEYISIGCPKLEYLDLGGLINLTDEMFECLFKCRNLKSIVIDYNPKITGKYFLKFPINFPNLNEFHIRFCESINREHVDSLKKIMPLLKIFEYVSELGYYQEEFHSDDILEDGYNEEDSCLDVDLEHTYFVNEMK